MRQNIISTAVLLALLAFAAVACDMTPEQRARVELISCGNFPPTGVSYAEMNAWCRAMQSGQPYTPIHNAAPIVRVQPPRIESSPTYVCHNLGGGTVRCVTQ